VKRSVVDTVGERVRQSGVGSRGSFFAWSPSVYSVEPVSVIVSLLQISLRSSLVSLLAENPATSGLKALLLEVFLSLDAGNVGIASHRLRKL
jgi:hypothetical protein